MTKIEVDAKKNVGRIKKSAFIKELKRNYLVYIVLIPIIIHFFIFQVIPFAGTIIISFFKWDYINKPKFAGLENWIRAFKDPIFLKALINTGRFTLYFVIPVVVLGLVLAIIINSKANKVGFVKGMYFLPVVTSFVVLAAIWRWLFASGNYGIINSILKVLGFPEQPFFVSPKKALPTLALLSIYKCAGTMMIYYFGGIKNIPESLYEAATIDGAGSWRKFTGITLPLLRPTTVYILMLATNWSFQIFDSAYLITSGGPNNSTQTVVYQIYINAFTGFNGGYASSLSVILFVIIFVITFIQQKVLDKEVSYL